VGEWEKRGGEGSEVMIWREVVVVSRREGRKEGRKKVHGECMVLLHNTWNRISLEAIIHHSIIPQ